MSEAPAPQVDVIARPVGLNLVAPQTNPALELAQSLTGVNEALGPALQGYAKEEQARLGLKAQADAMANSGAAFADAVRSGKLQPTQNPWYVQAYEENAAQVRAQAQGAQLVTDAQSWAERNDPQAFATKWQQSVGQLAEGYQGIDQAKGFKAAMQPLSQQALNSNVNYNVQRIQQDHVQDATTLSTQALMDTLAATPQAAPDQLFDAIEPQHQKWLSVGGTESQWRLLTKQAFVGAAANTNNPDLLEALKAPYRGGEPIANQADEKGKAVGLEIDSDKYWIARGSEVAGMAAIAKARNATAVEGYAAQKTATDQFGPDLYSGKVAPADIQSFLIGKGVSPQGAAFAIGQINEDVAKFDSLNRATMAIHSSDPTKARQVLSLWSDGAAKGWSPDYEDRVSQAVLSHQIGLPDAEQMIVRARETSRQIVAEGRAEQHAARAEANSARTLGLQETSDIQAWTRQSLDATAARLVEQFKDNALASDPKRRATLEHTANGKAIEAYRKSGSVEAAKEAADAVYTQYYNGRMAIQQQRHLGPAGGNSNSGNPLRNP